LIRRRTLVLVGLLSILAAVVAGCGGGSSSGSTTREAKVSRPAASGVSKRGVVKFVMATIGDPGNPSVGVIQTFGGPKGEFVKLPKGTGIYKQCSEAPNA